MDSSYPPNGLDQPQDPPELPKSVDKSEGLFSMYLDRSDEDDRKVTEKWKGETDAMLIFTGLFSAALAALLSVSIQDLRPSSQDTSAFYLANIYRLLANTTSPQPGTLPIPANPPDFSPPTYAVLVNSLWFLSLIMSLTAALLAVSIQQWAQNYLQATQMRRNPRDRARIRAFYFEGIDNWHLRRVTRAVPTLVHISLFLFFSGLPIFLFHVNLTVFNVVLSWLGLCLTIYACITFMPAFFQDCPYSSPLSSTAWFFVTSTLYVVHQLLKCFTSRDHAVFRWYRSRYTSWRLHWPSLREMQKVAEHSVNRLSSNIDYRALTWMFDTLNDDDEFEQFFDALPAICAPETLVDSQAQFIRPNENKLSHALIGMMDRTMLSDLVSESVKQRRIIIYTKVVTATSLLGPWWTLRRVLLGDWRGLSKFIQFGLFVQSRKNLPDRITAFYAQYVVAITMSGVQDRDESWFQLASCQLNASKSLLQNYYQNGDTILLVNAMFIIRRTIECYVRSTDRHRSEIFLVSSKALESLCKFDILQTFPEYHNEFCRLWDELVNTAQNDDYSHVAPLSVMILKRIRRLYIDLHRGTSAFPLAFSTTTNDGDPVLNNATSYPLCTIMEHLPSRAVPQLQLRNSISDAAGVNPPETASLETSPNMLSAFTPVLPSEFITPSSIPPPLIFTPVPLPRMAPTYPYPPYAPGAIVGSSWGQDDLFIPPDIESPVFPSPPTPSGVAFVPPDLGVARASQSSDSPPRHHLTQPSSSVYQPPDVQAGVDAPVQSDDNPGDHLANRTFSVRFDDNVSDGGDNMRTPSPVVRVEESSFTDIPMGMPTPLVGRQLANSAMAMASPSLGVVGLDFVPPQVLKFNQYGEYGGLLYHSPHSVVHQDELYPTALHLFEASRFLDHRPDLADRIKECERVEEVTSISAELSVFMRRDWGHVALGIMDDVLHLKFRQHSDLRTLLLNTYPAELIYVESGDPFWGDGAGIGMNELGKSLMRVRDRLCLEGGM